MFNNIGSKIKALAKLSKADKSGLLRTRSRSKRKPFCGLRRIIRILFSEYKLPGVLCFKLRTPALIYRGKAKPRK